MHLSFFLLCSSDLHPYLPHATCHTVAACFETLHIGAIKDGPSFSLAELVVLIRSLLPRLSCIGTLPIEAKPTYLIQLKSETQADFESCK